MDSVIAEFEQRVKEVDEYFKLLKYLSDTDVSLCRDTKKGKRSISIDREVVKVMKASSFLMLYNLVESTVSSSFEKIYEEMNSKSLELKELSLVFRNIWVAQKFRNMEVSSANQNSYRKLLQEMIEHVIDCHPIYLDVEKLPISGNLDARSIRQLYSKHDINHKVHYRALGGSDLVTIKDQRNALAHGSVSFSECGKMYTVDDLIQIKKKAVVFLKSAMRNVKSYLEKKSYAA